MENNINDYYSNETKKLIESKKKQTKKLNIKIIILNSIFLTSAILLLIFFWDTGIQFEEQKMAPISFGLFLALIFIGIDIVLNIITILVYIAKNKDLLKLVKISKEKDFNNFKENIK